MKQHSETDLAPLTGGRRLKELKNLEWIFIGIHSLGVPTVIVMVFLHCPQAASPFYPSEPSAFLH